MSDLRIDRNAKTLRELTLDKLRGAIVQGYFRPGARLVERTLCDELGVSRTVVREVLRHLETEGLVEIVARQGVSLKFGARQNMCRFPHVAPSSADFDRRLRDYDVDIYTNFYGPFFPQMPQGDADSILEGMKKSELIFNDFTTLVSEWLKLHAKP